MRQLFHVPPNMSHSEYLHSMITWLVKADFDNPMSELGPVSEIYRDNFLSGFELDPVTEFYFAACIPQPSYECTVGKVGFNMLDSDWLVEDTYDSSYSEVLTALGFRIIGRSMGATPLLLDPIDGKVYDFHSGYLYDDMLKKPNGDKSWKKATATREAVSEWSDAVWDGLVPFFEFAKSSTERMYRDDVLGCIEEADIAFLRTYLELGLSLDKLVERGRGPLDIAKETGNKEVFELVDTILGESS